jgi:acyl carrier protein
MNSKIVQVMAKVFKVAPEAIKPDSRPGAPSNWDSLSHLQMVLEIEATFGVRFTTEEIGQLTSAGAIEGKLKEKVGAIDVP